MPGKRQEALSLSCAGTTAQMKLLRKQADYEAFLRVLDAAQAKHPMRILAYWLMPTHWHFVLWPEADGQLSAFLRWLTLTHSVRWQAHYHRTGSGRVLSEPFQGLCCRGGRLLVDGPA